MSAAAVALRSRARVSRHLKHSLRTIYYNRAYGTSFPLLQQVGARIRTWELQEGRGDVPLAPADWDEQYAGQHWDFLTGVGELAHYAVIAAYGSYLRPHAAVLDLGCGEGVLYDRYLPLGCRRYVGVDISQTAVARLAERASPENEFVAQDAETYEPDGAFDVIIFNESITYFTEPEASFERYARWLAPDGIMIVSCHVQSPRAQAIQRNLKTRHEVMDETVVQQGSASWRVTVLRPAADGPTGAR